MFLHRLTLTNVGPFAGRHEIDFGKLSGTSLFLLEGPTGAGKSTILDALVFVLYGQVAGPYATSERMRSQFCSADELSSVELIFETTSGIYRVVRTPAFLRPKKNGTGTTPAQSTISLWRLARTDCLDGELLSNRHGEAEDEVQRIVGLSRQQFTQTVVLPQGEFASFLRASPVDRTKLLQRLFGTELYESMTKQLECQRIVALQSVADSHFAVQRTLTAFLTAAQCSPDTVSALNAAEESNELLPAVASVVATIDRALDSAVAARDSLAAKSSAATHEFDAHKRLAGLHQAHGTLLVRQATLDGRREDIKHSNRLLEQTRRLVSVGPSFDSLVAARGALAVSHRAAKCAADQIRHRFGNHELSDQPMQTSVQYTATADKLLHLVPMENASALAMQRMRSATERVHNIGVRLERAELELSSVPTTLAELGRRRALLTHAASLIDHLSKDHADTNERLAAARRAEQFDIELRNQVGKVRKQTKRATELNMIASSLRQQRIDGIAGELAEGLQAASACPVCGSVEHPMLAQTSVDHPSAAIVAHAEAELFDAIDHLERFKARRDDIDKALAAELVASDHVSVELCEKELRLAYELVENARSAAVELLLTEAEIAAVERERLELEDLLIGFSTDLGEATEHERNLKSEWVRIDRELLSGRDLFTTVAERINDLRDRARAHQALADRRRDSDVDRTNVSQRESELLGLLAALEIPSEDDFVAAIKTRPDMDELETSIRAYEAEAATVSEALSMPELVDLPALPTRSLPENEAAAAFAIAALDAAIANCIRASDVAERSHSSAADLRTALAAQRRIAESTRAVIRMAEVATGNSSANLRRIPLPTYALISRFKDVIAAANERLAGMSDGRYELRHTYEREGRGRKSGLGLLVRDHTTELNRSPGDLSGGEAFYTALSLALGLADVVTAEAGGVELGTLFIDEGFGSLDAVTLDSVLNEIGKLRAGGRVVGVVSHVDELKQRITDRIEVRRIPGGSSTVRLVA